MAIGNLPENSVAGRKYTPKFVKYVANLRRFAFLQHLLLKIINFTAAAAA
ncbi:hypothetical protein [Pseudoduganella chitinolytica]|uniref:Uncharacterized protein n=1 Tax=Pseudoduganella chitinolytica TaxID=34070 RepID=A0ABY8BFD9_9BURK|nr:hypothetical protein [Pseudoduganella chitinolytica]WEF34635.1 hypothetical protein PX653_07700 [Pseudoduganella chitinolytica]